MPQPGNVDKARLEQIRLGDGTRQSEVTDPGATCTVPFNPETLKVSYSNTMSGGDQAGGAAIQFVSKSSTKLSVELWFDVTADPAARDVRSLTNKVNHFFVPVDVPGHPGMKAPPPVRFSWGSFLFEGIMQSMDESIELFSTDGRPLRSKVSISIASQDIQSRIQPTTGAAGTAATRPRLPAVQGEGLQQMLGRSGDPSGWQSVARANNIENPRHLPAGSFVDPAAGAPTPLGG